MRTTINFYFCTSTHNTLSISATYHSPYQHHLLYQKTTTPHQIKFHNIPLSSIESSHPLLSTLAISWYNIHYNSMFIRSISSYSIFIIFITHICLTYSCDMPNKVYYIIYKGQYTTNQYSVTSRNISTSIYYLRYNRNVSHILNCMHM